MLKQGAEVSKLLESLNLFPSYSVKFISPLEDTGRISWALVRVWGELGEVSQRSWSFENKPSSSDLSRLLDYYGKILIWTKENSQIL